MTCDDMLAYHVPSEPKHLEQTKKRSKGGVFCTMEKHVQPTRAQKGSTV